MGMEDVRILVNIQVPERPLHHFIKNILYLYITKHRRYSDPTQNQQAKVEGAQYINRVKGTLACILLLHVI
jgi:hypothetical protein